MPAARAGHRMARGSCSPRGSGSSHAPRTRPRENAGSSGRATSPRRSTRRTGRATRSTAGPIYSSSTSLPARRNSSPTATSRTARSRGPPMDARSRSRGRVAVLLPVATATPGPIWSKDNASVTFIAGDRGNAHLVRTAIGDGSTNVVVGGERQILLANASAGLRIAFVAGDLEAPSDLYVTAWDGSGERRLTHLNTEILSQLPPVHGARRTFTSPHGGTLEGWIFLSGDRRGASPLLVDIHGGPQSFTGNLFSLSYFYRYVLASRGWAVLALNPTGSGSYGREFAHGIRGKWGEHDLAEQLAAVDQLVAEGIADPDRLAVAGYSYGGFMTSWTIGHTDRFKAAVVGAPVVNQESFFGTSDIGMWFAPWEMGAGITEGREIFRRLSPINYVDKVTTPTLVLHGEADERCPIGQDRKSVV